MSKYTRKKPLIVPESLCKLMNTYICILETISLVFKKFVVVKREDCDDICAYNSTTVSDKLVKSPLKKVLKNGHWTPEEDKKLKAIVTIYGPNRWEKISTYHPTRNGKQMRT
ncbi:3065_t:CDS:2 [Paraglomus occultum]|uniref:3065_t:CDS:1 n=1 Tax=Paraglomus occultum TaxID=144539 RepID=A0A9N8ZFJ9_9GLOM|nr:3065_t:CDS:2 [Paraglomus occultum]